jgi:ABC-type lipoprotein release transport system permease subunit
MRLSTLLLRTVLFHARSNVAVLLGVMIGTAVLTGSLLVGDSLRGSLRDLTLQRLGHIDHALVSDRFFGEDLADDLAKQATSAQRVVPVVVLRGSVIRRDAAGTISRRAGRVQIVGVDERFWPLFDEQRGDLSTTILINQPLATELAANRGDFLEVRLERPQAVPTDSILGRPIEDVGLTIEASQVAEILPAEGAGRFSLSTQQERPLLVYVQLRRLQNRLRESLHAGGLANALLCSAPADVEPLRQALQRATRLEDFGLTLRPDGTGQRYLILESRRLLIDPAVVEAVLAEAKQKRWPARPLLTYLANRISRGDRSVPYSTIAGLDPSEAFPWGPFVPVDGGGIPTLGDDEIMINEWLAADLWPNGDWKQELGKPVVRIEYFVEGEGWLLKEEHRMLKLAGVLQMTGRAVDRTLTPEFPGIRGTRVRDWQPPFPKEQWHPEWVRDRDDEYWRQHRATPKAFVSPALAAKLWKSKHGEFTAIRLAPKSPLNDGTSSTLSTGDLKSFEADLRRALRAALVPEGHGLVIQPVKAQGLAAAGSSTAEMFGWLFLGFSFFLIGAAAMLVGLLFRLGIERRAKEIGLLLAEGYERGVLRRLLLAEGAMLAVCGGILGTALAVGYAWVLLELLGRWWQDSLQTSFLELHVAAREDLLGPLPYPSLTLGFFLSFFVAMLAIVWALRGLTRLSPRALLAGQTAVQSFERKHSGRRWLTTATAPILLCGALVLAAISFFVSPDVAAPLFFGTGGLLLVAGLAGLRRWLTRGRGPAVSGVGVPALLRLGSHNADRSPGRSLLTMGLLASATFLVVAVESFRKSAQGEAHGRESGTGGFTLLAEADVPLFQSPATPEQRRGLLAGTKPAQLAELETALEGVQMFGFRLRPGDDVSCLNLYQPQQPRILGVPAELRERGGFQFASLFEANETERQNPWRLLERAPANEIPVLADDHTAEWVLKKSPGDTWDITNEQGQTVRLRLVGLLRGSIFQSELLMADEQFRRHFPSRGGYGYFLLDTPADRSEQVKQGLETAFGERFGFNVLRTSDRLAAFHAVENTYLSTFQVLGGLGVLLGTCGLAVVLLRNIWERRGELALLRALGYARSHLGWLVLAENGFLVLMGLALGLVTALVAVTPHLLERAGSLPWLGILGLVGLILLFGIGAGVIAILSTLRTPLLPALRRE